MSGRPVPDDWRSSGDITALAGYAYGCRYPSLVLNVEGRALSPDEQRRLWDGLRAGEPSIGEPDGTSLTSPGWRQSVEWLLGAWQSLQVAMGLPVYEAGRILALSPGRARCAVPGLWIARRDLAAVILQTFTFLSNASADGGKDAAAALAEAIRKLRTYAPAGSNVPRLVRAAYELHLPFHELPASVYQFGTAARARWMDSSFTDVTPTISAQLSRNKVWASLLLRQAGLPVPTHRLVTDVSTALTASRDLGYPVVVKPADRDGGVGVAAGLTSDDEVRAAYDAARKHSDRVLVEKHVGGKDYRLTVFNGQVIWAIERVPAGVSGDGRRTVAELVAQVNADPRRGEGNHAPLKRLILDDEARDLLRTQGLADHAIPAPGRFVRLRRAANVASGGTPVAVFDKVHPDNARLAVRAADVLRLDLAGIDLLIPDISVSWRDSAAAICEVNGQPNLGQTTAAHVYAPILLSLVAGSGRVPVVLVLGASQPQPWLDALEAQWADEGAQVGVAGPAGVTVGDELIYPGPVSPYDGGKMLVLNRHVDVIVLALNDDSILDKGLPCDRCDAIVLAGTDVRFDSLAQGESPQHRMAELLRGILPACDGVILQTTDGELKLRGVAERTEAVWHSLQGSVGSMAVDAVAMIRAIVVNREKSFARDGTPFRPSGRALAAE